MSVVACKITKEQIEISADSIVVRGYTQEKATGKFAKLIETNNMIIGGVGHAAENGMMQIFASTRKPEASTESGLLNFVAEFASWKKKTTDKYEIFNNFIIAFEGHAFLCEEFCVKEITDYAATGAGMDYALAALYLGNDTKKAVETACELCVYCERPIVTFTMPRI